MSPSSWRVSRGWPAGQVVLAGALALAQQGACGRGSAPDSMDDFVQKEGWLTVAADGHRDDYDGDGISDFDIFRPSSDTWYLLRSTAGSWSGSWGAATDWPIQGDFDHDGKDDVGVFRPSTGEWFV